MMGAEFQGWMVSPMLMGTMVAVEATKKVSMPTQSQCLSSRRVVPVELSPGWEEEDQGYEERAGEGELHVED